MFEVVRQRSSPPPNRARQVETPVYEVAQLFGERLAWGQSLSSVESAPETTGFFGATLAFDASRLASQWPIGFGLGAVRDANH